MHLSNEKKLRLIKSFSVKTNYIAHVDHSMYDDPSLWEPDGSIEFQTYVWRV